MTNTHLVVFNILVVGKGKIDESEDHENYEFEHDA